MIYFSLQIGSGTKSIASRLNEYEDRTTDHGIRMPGNTGVRTLSDMRQM